MSKSDLEHAPRVDLASVQLDYEGFRKLARNTHLTTNEKIGFPDSYRAGFGAAIFADICAKLPALQRPRATIVDIGPGCGELPRMLIALCEAQNHKLVLVDSADMLDQIPNASCAVKVPGPFPHNADAVAASGLADAILCYSVMHYLYVDADPFEVIDRIAGLLAPGGVALIGDIPNASKRRRFFSSEAGIRYHRQFTGRNDLPELGDDKPEPGRIDDAVLAGLVARAQSAGCDAYIVPQPDTLPMANRRDDLLICKP